MPCPVLRGRETIGEVRPGRGEGHRWRRGEGECCPLYLSLHAAPHIPSPGTRLQHTHKLTRVFVTT